MAVKERDDAQVEPFRVERPCAQHEPFVFNSPHSGSHYPRDFVRASRLDARAIRRSEDVLVDDLFAGVVARGAPLMRAVYPRAYVDVNREPYELDPKLFAEALPPFANARSVRVAGGLGTVPRVVADAQEIYRAPIRLRDAMHRIDTVYRPYHDMLRGLLARTYSQFGVAVLVDCHSMPSAFGGRGSSARPDFVLGDRYGTSCAPAVVDVAHQALRDMGYAVSRNKPYAGGFITEHYGRPERGLHSLQVEVNRALYMNERTLEPHSGFARLRDDVMKLVEALMALPLRVAASGEPLEVEEMRREAAE